MGLREVYVEGAGSLEKKKKIPIIGEKRRLHGVGKVWVGF